MGDELFQKKAWKLLEQAYEIQLFPAKVNYEFQATETKFLLFASVII